MISTFLYAFNAIFPILFLALAGYYLRNKGIFTIDFFKKLNYFAFHYCFPPLMFTNLYALGSVREINVRLAAYLMGSIVFITLISFFLANIITVQKKEIKNSPKQFLLKDFCWFILIHITPFKI